MTVIFFVEHLEDLKWDQNDQICFGCMMIMLVFTG